MSSNSFNSARNRSGRGVSSDLPYSNPRLRARLRRSLQPRVGSRFSLTCSITIIQPVYPSRETTPPSEISSVLSIISADNQQLLMKQVAPYLRGTARAPRSGFAAFCRSTKRISPGSPTSSPTPSRSMRARTASASTRFCTSSALVTRLSSSSMPRRGAAGGRPWR